MKAKLIFIAALFMIRFPALSDSLSVTDQSRQQTTTVKITRTFNDAYKVLSWGGVQLIDNKAPINALLIQMEYRLTKTILINGEKAPQQVLAPLKLTQDATSSVMSYSFRNFTFPDNIAEFGLNGTTVAYLNSISTVE